MGYSVSHESQQLHLVDDLFLNCCFKSEVCTGLFRHCIVTMTDQKSTSWTRKNSTKKSFSLGSDPYH